MNAVAPMRYSGHIHFQTIMPTHTTNVRTGKTYFENDPDSFFVAGFPYTDAKRQGWTPGRDVYITLELEPTNRYDKEAILVLCGTTKLGYVPRPLNTFLKHLLDRKFTLSSFDPMRAHAEAQVTMLT